MGNSLSGDGSILAVGAFRSSNNGSESGSVSVYQLVGNSWVQQGSDLNGLVASDQLGVDVELSQDGTLLAATANEHNGNRGHALMYEYDGSAWNQIRSEIEYPDANGYLQHVFIGRRVDYCRWGVWRQQWFC